MKRTGFTLIELSIVIVIIALIIGGILVGRNLIETAQIRQLITTHEQVSAAANTFKAKYGHLPGDIPRAQALNFGLASCTHFYCGNGDKTINGWMLPGGLPTDYLYENGLFWRHLTQTELLRTSLDLTATVDPVQGYPTPAPATEAEVWRYIPKSPYKGSLYLSGFALNNRPGVGLLFARTTSMGFNIPTGAVLTPAQAFYIDSKADDGAPDKGTTYARCNITPTDPLLETTGKSYPCNQICVTGLSTKRYDASGATADAVSCELIMIIPTLNQ